MKTELLKWHEIDIDSLPDDDQTVLILEKENKPFSNAHLRNAYHSGSAWFCAETNMNLSGRHTILAWSDPQGPDIQ